MILGAEDAEPAGSALSMFEAVEDSVSELATHEGDGGA